MKKEGCKYGEIKVGYVSYTYLSIQHFVEKQFNNKIEYIYVEFKLWKF